MTADGTAQSRAPTNSQALSQKRSAPPVPPHLAKFLSLHDFEARTGLDRSTIADRLAVAAAGWLLRSGRRVPEDVSVACIDDPELLSFCYPAITAMSFDYRQAGMRAARMLIDNIEGKADGERPEKGAAPPVEVVMPHTLRVRESTGGPEAKR